jgi:hypothetical protein
MNKIDRGVAALAVLTLIILVCVTLLEGAAWAAAAGKKSKFTTDFRIEDCDFSDTGRNAYFSLNPGNQLILEDRRVRLEITVLNETHVVTLPEIGDITTRVVEERETENGAPVETSRNFFARCEQTNDIFYFGETVEPASIGGAWQAGVDGAVPGIIMPARFLLGSRYFQEQAPGVALDRAEHTKMGLTIDDPKNQNQPFEDCVEVVETTKLERGKSIKRYCPGVGLVFDDGLELTDYNIQ